MEISKQTRDNMILDITKILDTHDFLKSVDVASFDHHFKGFGTHPSKIRVHLLKSSNDLTIVIFEDLGIGTSVTNASEQLANEIGTALKLDPDPLKTAWIEYYPYNSRNEYLDRITYTMVNGKYTDPEWRAVDNKMLADFIKKVVGK